MLKRSIAFVMILVLCFVLCSGMAVPALGAEAESGTVPYESYNYDYWETFVFTPAAYAPGASISGVTLGIGAFADPQGMCVAANGTVYIADTGNNRIVILSPELTSVIGLIEEFDNNGFPDHFSRPMGVAVSDDGLVYVADSENRRVVAITDNAVVQTITSPQSEMLDRNYDFVPLKVTVDYAGRVFVIGRNMFQGIMTFDPDGKFIGFFGTIKVKITLWERMWRALATKTERAKQQLFIPTEFTGMDVDPAGFVYASNFDKEGKQAVQRLNPRGEDVIRKGDNEHVGGDIAFYGGSSVYAGPSKIIDVTYRGSGIYSLLDSRRGRIFTYDHEGNLLYIFGGPGDMAGTFRQPTAIGAQADRLLVLDAVRNEIITFQQTRYGELINSAVALRYDGDETKAAEAWREVLLLNEGFELANAGIGKVFLTTGDYVNAMSFLKLGMDRANYSIAFKRYRNEVLKENLGWVLTLLLSLVFLYVLWRVFLKRKVRTWLKRRRLLPARRALQFSGEPDPEFADGGTGADDYAYEYDAYGYDGAGYIGDGYDETGNNAPVKTPLAVRFRYMTGILSRPIDSFYEIRYRERGSVPLALACVFIFSVCYTINRIFAGFVVNNINPRSINGLTEMGAVFLLLGLFCVGNWSVTCLMEGEGRLKDIITVTGYAMLPLIITLIPATLLSRVIADGEEAFYYIIIGIGIAWTIILLLLGVMTVHNYTLAKTLVTLILTFVAMLIVIFVALLILDMINQAYGFLYSLYTELVYRI